MITSKKLISIIMPTYNAEKYIKEAVESIIKQTYCNWELIIVDDYSIDSTRQIINEYIQMDERIKLVDGKKQGVGAALNLGIEVARGDYIARMDADDISLPLRLETQINFMDNHSDVGVCATQYSLFANNKVQQNNVCEFFTDQDIKAEMIFYNVIGHPTVMIRKKVFDEGWRYNENIIGEDYDLWTRMIPTIKFECLQDMLFYYRWENQNSTLLIDIDKRIKSDIRIIKTCITRLFKIDLSNYDDNIFGGNGGYYQINDMCVYLIKQLRLLNQIDLQNQKLKVLSFDALRKSLQIRWKSLLDFIKIPDDVLLINNALFIKNLNELFEDKKNLDDYKSKLEEIQEYYGRLIKTLKNVIIYGVGTIGKEVIAKYLILKEQKKINCELKALIDENIRKVVIDSKEYIVNAPSSIEQSKPDFVLICTTKYYEEIKSQLEVNGVDRKHIFSGNVLWFL